MKTIRNLMFTLKLSTALMITVMVFSSCSDEDPSPNGIVNLTVTGAGNPTIDNARTGARAKAEVTFTDFQISIRDVVFKTDNDDDGVLDDSTEVSFRGPYQLDLLSGNDALSQTIGSVEVPNGIYDELRFKFHKDEDLSPEEPLYDRSIFIKGTIDGTPFEMWHDTSENLDVAKNSGGVVVNNNVVNVSVVFTIDQFLNSLVEIDLGNARDGNGDGLIEINPNDEDGNKELAEELKKNIKASADLLDENS